MLLAACGDADLGYQRSDEIPRKRIENHRTAAVPRTDFPELLRSGLQPSVRGNPLLTDSELYNAEARYEWYFDRDQRVTLRAFFKRIDKPIEAFSSFDQNSVITSFANAPKADLYGAEIETQKYFDLSGLGEKAFSRPAAQWLLPTIPTPKSKISVKPGDPVAVFNASSTSALDFFTDGSPLTGQSDHLVNLQLGLEDTERLSQQTIVA